MKRNSILLPFIWLVFLAGFTATVKGQSGGNLTGTVLDNENIPLPGVNIVIKGKPGGTVTDLDGKYTLSNVSSTDTISFSFVGYLQEVEVIGNRTTLNVTLMPDLITLEDVMVIGYGTQKRSDLTSAITTVEAKDITSLPVVGLSNALSGKAAGVFVTSSSGAPGDKTVVRIRGMNSANNPDPIYVVDGIIMGSNVDFLSPSDIESIEIMKDASATAIYGSQGAGGVVMVTTKKGVAGRSSISFDAYTGLQQTWNRIDMMNSAEFAKTYNQLQQLKGLQPVFPDPDTNQADFYSQYPYDTDWQDQIFRTAPVSSYTLSYSGGNDKATVLASGNYYKQDGIVKTSDYERMTLRLNTTVKLWKNVTIGENVSFVHTNRSRVFENQEDLSPIIKAIQSHPFIPVSDTGLFPEQTNNWSYSPIGTANNPVAMLNTQTEKYTSNLIYGNIYLNVGFLKYLTFNSTLGSNLGYNNSSLFRPEFFVTSSFSNAASTYNESINQSYSWQWFNTLTFQKVFFESHDLSLMIGMESGYGSSKLIGGSGTLLYDSEDMRFVNESMSNQSVTGRASDRSSYSYISRLQYSFLQRYLLTISFRRDGSSKFGPGNRYGNFPAASVGWKFSDEPFIKQLGILSLGKLRYGYGVVGGQNVDDSQWASNISFEHIRGYVTGEDQHYEVGGVPARLGNKNVKWENNISQNYGLDLGFWRNKLTFTIDYFKKRNEGMLVKMPLADISGLYQANGQWEGREVPYPLVNAGVVENKGYEFTLGYKNLDRALQYQFDFNLSHYENELVSIAGGEDFLAAQFSRGIGYVSVGKEGYPLGAFWGYETNGLFQEADAELIDGQLIVTNQPYTIEEDGRITYMQPGVQPGDIRYVDQNGDNKLDKEDQKMIGNPHPDFTIGFNSQVMYKGFDLGISIVGVFGNDIFNGLKFTYFNTDGGSNWHKDALDAYRSPVLDTDGNVIDAGNTDTDIPRLEPSGLNMSKVSDFFIEDGSFVRLKNLQLGYTFNERVNSWLHASKLRIYLSAYNLYTFTNYSGLDPEIGQGINGVLDIGVDRGAYPQARSYMVGVNLTF